MAMQKRGLGLCDVPWSCTFFRGSYSRAVQWSRERKGGHAWERAWCWRLVRAQVRVGETPGERACSSLGVNQHGSFGGGWPCVWMEKEKEKAMSMSLHGKGGLANKPCTWAYRKGVNLACASKKLCWAELKWNGSVNLGQLAWALIGAQLKRKQNK